MSDTSNEEARLSRQFSIRVTEAEYEAVMAITGFDQRKKNDMARIIFRKGLPVVVAEMQVRGLDVQAPPDPTEQRD